MHRDLYRGGGRNVTTLKLNNSGCLALQIARQRGQRGQIRVLFYFYTERKRKGKRRIRARNEIVLGSIESTREREREIRVFSLSTRIEILNDQDSTREGVVGWNRDHRLMAEQPKIPSIPCATLIKRSIGPVPYPANQLTILDTYPRQRTRSGSDADVRNPL